MQTKVVGLYYRPASARVAVEQLSPGDKVQLVAEPDNPYDAYAVKVLTGGIHIGYISAELSAYLDPPPAEATFVGVEESPQTIYPLIELDDTSGQ